MAALTLLEAVNKVLRSMSSQQVATISETTEATDIASMVEDVFMELVDSESIAGQKELVQLTALGDSSKPTHMKMPTNTRDFVLIQYDHADPTVSGEIDYRTIRYCDPLDFLAKTQGRDATDTTRYQTVTEDSGVKLIIDRDEYPTFCTSFDNDFLIFDAYQETDESSLQATKSLAYVQKTPTFSLDDAYDIDLDETYHQLLINEVRALAFIEKKQQQNPKAEQKARQQKVRIQNDRQKTTGSNGVPDYGRKR